MRKLLKSAALFFLLLCLSACWPCDPPLVIDRGPLPDSVKSRVPYIDGWTYYLKHSNGKVIGFSTRRFSYEEQTECERCCDIVYQYEMEEVIMRPDYPVFQIGMWMTSMDSLMHPIQISVGWHGFTVYPEADLGEEAQWLDSLQVGERWYRQVFRMKNQDHWIFAHDSLYPDSLYYNFTEGIIRLVMNNGEFYEIYR